ncbi:hypothetical protein SDC9_94547 [bioreactor metagenome]|uniref:Uncharacterized protein n=1 Tax=bioreactor metagenome TaxID=1076179 RepID=A0A645A4H0_9ZZZZ
MVSTASVLTILSESVKSAAPAAKTIMLMSIATVRTSANAFLRFFMRVFLLKMFGGGPASLLPAYILWHALASICAGMGAGGFRSRCNIARAPPVVYIFRPSVIQAKKTVKTVYLYVICSYPFRPECYKAPAPRQTRSGRAHGLISGWRGSTGRFQTPLGPRPPAAAKWGKPAGAGR